MVVLPPGTILQLLYLEERLRKLPVGRFIEVGPGGGEITDLLLKLGWSGIVYDLEKQTTNNLNRRFHQEVFDQQLSVKQENFITDNVPENKADLVISCMVMEHLTDDQETQFMQQARRLLSNNGMMIGLVPGSPGHWGIEDEIAGHCRRYTKESIKNLLQKTGWELKHIAGLTFPVSNLLLPISNYLVNKAEKRKLILSALERTKLSGRRNVRFKTHFPSFLYILLNKKTMSPLHYLQKLFSKSRKSLVIYFETKPEVGKI